MFSWKDKLLLPGRAVLRSQAIAWTFYRFGLGGALTDLGILVGKNGFHWVRAGSPPSWRLDRVFGKRLSKVFVHLGPTFIKAGQLLAQRPDLVGEEVSEELQILFDKVPPIGFSKIKAILIQEWGRKKYKQEILEVDKKPLGTASLGQTHQAKLKDGTPVIIKIQKPGVQSTVRTDLFLLEGFIRSAHLIFPALGLLDIFKEFRSATLRELDYREEAKNNLAFQKNYKRVFSEAEVVFPKCYHELTTERILVMEPMRGSQISKLEKGSLAAKKAASVGLAAVLEQIFEHGFFHADPHAGNLFFLEGEGRVGFIDLGLVGQLNPEDKKKFLKVLFALLRRDRKQLSQSLFEMGKCGPKANFQKFDEEVQAILDDAKKQGVGNLKMEKMINRLLSKARSSDIHIPNRYILMIRSCLLIEGVARSLDPSISVFETALPIVSRSLMKSYNPFRRFRK